MVKMKNIVISTCVCPKCNGEMFVPRKLNKTRNKGHLKKLWCPFCKKIRNMMEFRETKEYAKNMLGELLYEEEWI